MDSSCRECSFSPPLHLQRPSFQVCLEPRVDKKKIGRLARFIPSAFPLRTSHVIFPSIEVGFIVVLLQSQANKVTFQIASFFIDDFCLHTGRGCPELWAAVVILSHHYPHCFYLHTHPMSRDVHFQ